MSSNRVYAQMKNGLMSQFFGLISTDSILGIDLSASFFADSNQFRTQFKSKNKNKIKYFKM